LLAFQLVSSAFIIKFFAYDCNANGRSICFLAGIVQSFYTQLKTHKNRDAVL